MTHNELVGKILARAAELKLLAHYCGDSRKCKGAAGFPDLVIAGATGVIFREVKTGSGETTPQQDLWGWTIGRVGGSWHVWTEARWIDGTIEYELTRLT